MRSAVRTLLVVGATTAQLMFPREVDRVIVNIGPNLKPAQPHRENTHVIAIEPMVGCRIKPSDTVHVVHAAVSANDTLQFMNWYHGNGESSSLSTPTIDATWNQGPRNNRGPKLVSVISMRTVLTSIPTAIELWYLKMDMQGFDFKGLVAAGPLLKRAHYIMTEVWWGKVQSYSGVNNDFCADQFPYMTRMGFEVLRGEDGYKDPEHIKDKGTGQIDQLTTQQITELCETQRALAYTTGCNEGDVFWKRTGTPLEEPVWREAKENPRRLR